MDAMQVPPLSEGCFWSGWELPNLKWCEANLCSVITTPANTWSNLGYIIAGIWMLRAARGFRLGRFFGAAAIVVGVTSFIYHASYTWFFQFWDFFGMFVFAGLPVALNAQRLRWIPERLVPVAYLAVVFVFSALVPICMRLGCPFQLLVVVLILVTISQELTLWLVKRTPGSRRDWLLSIALILLGAVCSALDLSRTWCDPDNHWLQGHAVWHLLGAASLTMLFRFYRGLDQAPPLESPR